jgi:hypothetical protein
MPARTARLQIFCKFCKLSVKKSLFLSSISKDSLGGFGGYQGVTRRKKALFAFSKFFRPGSPLSRPRIGGVAAAPGLLRLQLTITYVAEIPIAAKVYFHNLRQNENLGDARDRPASGHRVAAPGAGSSALSGKPGATFLTR